MTNPSISFLQEIFKRLVSKSPKFFIVWQWIFGALTAVAGIPSLIVEAGWHLPAPFDSLLTKVVAVVSALVWFMSKLPVDTQPVVLTADGEVLKKAANAKALPFTSQDDKKQVVEKGIISGDTLHTIITKSSTIIILTLICSSCFAQSFFKPIPKNSFQNTTTEYNSKARVIFGDSVVMTPITKMQAFRPVTNVLSYFQGGSNGQILMAGAGVSYQWLHLDQSTQKWYSDFAINAIMYGGGNVAPPNNAVYAAGLSLSLFNGLLSIGGAYNFTLQRFGPTIGANIQLNN